MYDQLFSPSILRQLKEKENFFNSTRTNEELKPKKYLVKNLYLYLQAYKNYPQIDYTVLNIKCKPQTGERLARHMLNKGTCI